MGQGRKLAEKASPAKEVVYRCTNGHCADAFGVAFEFSSIEPVCPKCGVDGRTPMGADTVVKLAVIHFDPPSPIMNRGMHIKACDRKPFADQNTYVTGHPAAVTCLECKATKEFKEAAGAYTPPDPNAVKNEIAASFAEIQASLAEDPQVDSE